MPTPLDLAPESLVSRTNLSQSQLLLWLGQRLNPDVPLYNMALAFTIEGPLDPGHFSSAFQALLDRCEALRTTFYEVDGVPQQRVLDSLTWQTPLVVLPPEQQRPWMRERVQQNFILSERCFDSVLLKVGHDRHIWLFNQHHLTTDAWSASVVFRRLSSLYEAAQAGNLEDSPSTPKYSDYLLYERTTRSHLSGSELSYWEQKTAYPLPTFYGRRSSHDPRTCRTAVELEPELTRKLREIAVRPEVRMLTPNMSFFCLFASLLFAYTHRTSGESKLTMGAPSHNRGSADFKETIGLFIEILPISLELEPQETFLSLVGKVRREFSSFLRRSHPGASSASTSRGFNFLLNYIHATFPAFAGLPSSCEWLHCEHGDPRHLLRLQVHDFGSSGEFRLEFDLNRSVFPDPQRCIRHFLRLFNAVLDDPDQPLGKVALADPDHSESFLKQAPTSSQKTLLDNLWTGPGLALRCGERALNYSELWEKVDSWTRALLAHGVGPGQRVGICLPRSPELVIGILATLKAGGTYVPIDPAYPRERVEFILEDSRSFLLLTGAGSPPLSHPKTLFLDRPAPTVSKETAKAPNPGDPAYIIYTSGSTGQPKGVSISHASLHNYLQWAKLEYTQGKRLCFGLFTSIAFDLTVTSLFLPLISGGVLNIYPETSNELDLALLELLEEDSVEVLKLTPSHLTLAPHRMKELKSLKRVVLGGENLRRDQATLFSPSCQVFNEYGPTEATVGCLVYRFDPDQDQGTNVPIGRPAAGARAYILDDNLQLLPDGLVGELYLAGPGLALGYNHRAELDRQFFLDDPFTAGQRMYRSGDLARRRLDGVYEYLGRADHQVKIRGVRIELGEVESALSALPHIEQCVVDVLSRTQLEHSNLFYCVRCGLASNYPGLSFDTEGVCSLCSAYDSYRGRASEYFKEFQELKALFQTPGTGDYDCLALLSGGKDSSYVVYRLVEMGLRVLAFTLDNGFISTQAKANITRVVEALGVDHVFATTPHMNEIFGDSLNRHCNVCHGCFKTIYTLSTKLARDKGIRYVVTGLSRGQFFETRLTEELFTDPEMTSDRIDQTVLEARKAYHRVNDAVSRLLDVELFKDETIFEEVIFVDFYRYCDVSLEEVLSTLQRRLPWIRPDDTGRSTNCLINDVGIYLHKQEKGFHNYALPYSWDVRLGHKRREDALEELCDEIDPREVQRILDQIGYTQLSTQPEHQRLVAYYVSANPPTADSLRALLKKQLPTFMVPSYFVSLDEIPLTPNGKLDRQALPAPESTPRTPQGRFLPPRNPTEEALAAIWCDVLSLQRVGVEDNFFDLGGDSISAIRIVALANQAGLGLSHGQLFAHQTIAELCEIAIPTRVEAEQGLVEGEAALTPIQHWFFAKQLKEPGRWCHLLQLKVPSDLDRERLKQALSDLITHHDSLRLGFSKQGNDWKQAYRQDGPFTLDSEVSQCELEGPLFRACLKDDTLTLIIHHLVCDGLSWLLLTEDLEHLYAGRQLPAKTSSLKQWGRALQNHKVDSALYWSQLLGLETLLPVDREGEGFGAEASSDTFTLKLEASLTRAVEDLAKTLHCEVQEVLLSALVRALKQWSGQERYLIDLEAAGRDPIDPGLDLSRTVGWFTALHPALVCVGSPSEIRKQLQRVPNGGLDYGVLRYLRQELEDIRGPVLFNYLGRLGQLDGEIFKSKSSPRLNRDPEAQRDYLLEFYAMIGGDQMELNFVYSRQRHQTGTVEKLCQSMASELKALATNAFPLAGLDATQLARVAGLLKKAEQKGTP